MRGQTIHTRKLGEALALTAGGQTIRVELIGARGPHEPIAVIRVTRDPDAVQLAELPAAPGYPPARQPLTGTPPGEQLDALA